VGVQKGGFSLDKMNEKIGFEVLSGVKEILDRHNIHFWLDYGTLLGAIRDKRFIPSDNDIDITVFNEDIPKLKELKQDFRMAGYEVFYGDTDVEIKKKGCYIGISSYIFKGKYVCKKVPKDYEYNGFGRLMWYAWHILMIPNYCDIKTRKQSISGKMLSIFTVVCMKIIPYFIREKLWNGVDYLKDKYGAVYVSLKFPAHYFKSFTTTKFYGETYQVPKHYEDYLQARYGKNWRVPITNEQWTRADRAKQQLG